MENTDHKNAGNRMSRRTALKLTLAATFTPLISACKTNATFISQVNVIRVKKRSGEDIVQTYLELTTNSNISGYGGPLLDAQSKSLEKILSQLHSLLMGKDPM